MTPPDTTTPKPHQDGQRLTLLLKRLALFSPLAMLAVVLAVALSFYFLQVAPQAKDSVSARQKDATERVITQIGSMVGQVESLLLSMQGWSQSGLARQDDPLAFNRLFMPLLERHGIISSIHLADEDGHEILLLKTPDGWKNRITDVPKEGKRQHWLVWRDAGATKSEEWKEQDYDPRKRPWFSGAIGVAENRIHWTAPYVFQSTQDPGITAALHWVDKTTGKKRVVAFDVLLTDLSRFTAALDFGGHGQVALLTEEGKVLGLPRLAGFETDEALKAAVLQTPDKIGLPILAAALEEAQAQSTAIRVPAQRAGSKEDWLVSLKPFSLRNQALRIATLAPVSDLMPWSGGLTAALGGLIALIILIGGLVAHYMRQNLVEPLEGVFIDMQVVNQNLSKQMAQAVAVADIAPRLQACVSLSELSQVFLSSLATHIGLTQGSVYKSAPETGDLRCCGGYARQGSLPERIALGEGLAGQCALEAKAIEIKAPPPGYGAASALGECEAANLLLLPLMHKGTLLGILELATDRALDEEQRALIDNLILMMTLCMEIVGRNEGQA